MYEMLVLIYALFSQTRVRAADNCENATVSDRKK